MVNHRTKKMLKRSERSLRAKSKRWSWGARLLRHGKNFYHRL